MSIETRNSVPSRSSLKEGQIVIAKDPKKGLSMFIKSGAETYSIPISSATKENVFDSMTINGNARINNKLISDTIDTRNLSYTKFTDYRTFQHNFNDDIATTKHYIPWNPSGGEGEQVNMRAFTSYLAPFKMTFYKLLVRPSTLIATSDYTFTIDFVKDGSITQYELGSYTHRNVLLTDSETHFVVNGSDFLINAPYDSLTVNTGDKAGISIQASVDPSNSIYWIMTSVWKVEVDLS